MENYFSVVGFVPLSFKMTLPSLEGPLTKWTNVMKGWQHRWFVLDENAGLLSYYTSREKMMRGVRRGCVRLKGAILGIDNEEDGNFTITTDSKTFHFQARNSAEREVWVRALEDTILRHAVFPHEHQVQPIVFLRKHMPHQLFKVHFEEEEDCSYEANMKKFDSRIAEADFLLQMLIEQTESLDSRINAVEDEALKVQLGKFSHNYKLLAGAVKLAIVRLQILKNTIDPNYGIGLVTSHYKSKKSRTLGSHFYTRKLSASFEEQVRVSREAFASGGLPETRTNSETKPTEVELGSDCLEGRRLMPAAIESLSHVASPEGMTLIVPPEMVPETSYSSSEDDEDFYDADEEFIAPMPTRANVTNFINLGNGVKESTSQLSNVPGTSNNEFPGLPVPPMRNDGSLDYDALYEEEDEQGDISMENHGSMITHLLSQVKIGMDLTKVVLPTFILETRSLLEMYADYFAHPDMFVSISDKKSPKERMIQVVKWYMSAYHAGRKSSVAKKPYNPILGEVFQCHWDIPGFTETADNTPVVNGPIPWCKRGQLSFIAEQVSHHPPVSAFYAECVAKKICFEAFVYTKSKFLGLSVGVHNIGHGTVHVLDCKEDYVVTFPSGYGRSILTTPWIELGGTVSIVCKKTGYNANIEFHTKPFYGGKKHKITGEIYSPTEKKPFLTISGEWNGLMEAKNADTGKSEVFVDVLKTPVTKKTVQSVFEQKENESRNLWKEVTAGLKLNDIDKATMAKTLLEQKQRDEAKKRKERGASWEPKGWNDVGFHGSNQIKTLNIDALAYSGIILNRHYVLPSCTPSRSALLTGLYPIRTGLQGYPLRGGENRNLPLTVKLKPEFLRDLGYRTHLIGKWHLGYETSKYVPNRRGFDSFFGYYNGYIDYYKFGYNQSLGNEHGEYFYGYDLHLDDGVYRPDEKIYATRLFTKRAESIIESHNASEPLYLYFSHLATHTGDDEIGMEVPEDVDSNAAYPHIKDVGRRAFAGCLEELDESIGTVMEALKKKGMLENSIVLVMSDNGGHTVSTDMPPNWSSNWPLAGTKFTMFEGGIRGVALMWSPLLPNGVVSEEFFHITDWLPTFYSAAGGDLSRLGPIDGKNQWEALRNLSKSRRDQILINVDERTKSEGVIIENRWKVIKGGQPNYGNYDYHWGREENIEPDPEYDFDSILTSKAGVVIRSLGEHRNLLNRTLMEGLRRKSTVDCRPPENDEILQIRDGFVEPSNRFRCRKFCVFDIIEDPCELNPIRNEEIVKMAQSILAEHKKRMIHQTETRVDPKSNPINFDGVWMPWKREQDQFRKNSSSLDFAAAYLNTSLFLTLSWCLFRRI